MRMRMKLYSGAITVIFMILLTTVIAVSGTTSAEAQEASYRAVIIRGAGHLPGTKPTEGPDAITHATSEPGNTYVFSERLVKELEKNGVQTVIVNYMDCGDLSCVNYTNSTGTRRAVDFVILAGPSYNRYLPKPVLSLLHILKEKLADNPDVICSSMISGNYTYRVVDTMVNTDLQLREIGAITVPGLVLNSDVIKQELDEDVRDFVSKLLDATKNE